MPVSSNTYSAIYEGSFKVLKGHTSPKMGRYGRRVKWATNFCLISEFLPSLQLWEIFCPQRCLLFLFRAKLLSHSFHFDLFCEAKKMKKTFSWETNVKGFFATWEIHFFRRAFLQKRRTGQGSQSPQKILERYLPKSFELSGSECVWNNLVSALFPDRKLCVSSFSRPGISCQITLLIESLSRWYPRDLFERMHSCSP